MVTDLGIVWFIVALFGVFSTGVYAWLIILTDVSISIPIMGLFVLMALGGIGSLDKGYLPPGELPEIDIVETSEFEPSELNAN